MTQAHRQRAGWNVAGRISPARGWLWTAIFAAAALWGCTALDESAGEVDGDFSLSIHDVRPEEHGISDAARREVCRLLGKPVGFLHATRLYRASIQSRDSGEALEGRLALVPLGGRLEGARVCVAMDEQGQVLEIAVHGTRDFDDDPIERWKYFLKRLRRSAEKATPPPLAYSSIEPTLARIEREADAGRTARLLARTKLAMSRVSMLIEQLAFLLNDGQLVPAAWLDPVIADFAALAAAEPDLEALLGNDGARRFAEHAVEARAVFEALRTTIEERTPSDALVEIRARIKGGLCRRCHHGRSEGAELDWQDSLSARAAELGVPLGVMKVGFDTPAAWGDDGSISHEIAAAARAGMLLSQR